MSNATQSVSVGALATVLVAFADQKYGVKLSPEEAAGLVALVLAGYHSALAAGQWAWQAWQLYHPPPVRPAANPQPAAQPPGAK